MGFKILSNIVKYMEEIYRREDSQANKIQREIHSERETQEEQEILCQNAGSQESDHQWQKQDAIWSMECAKGDKRKIINRLESGEMASYENR